MDFPLLLRHPEPAPFPYRVAASGAAPRPDAADEGSDRPLKPLLSVADLMALFNRSERTIRRWAEKGHLASVQIGRSLFFREEDVRALIAKRLSRRVLARSQGPVSDPAAPADTPGDDPSK